MTIHGRRLSVAAAMGLLLDTGGSRSSTRATRGYLAVLMWAIAAAFGSAVRVGMPVAERETADAVPTVAIAGAVVLAVVPWRGCRTAPAWSRRSVGRSH